MYIIILLSVVLLLVLNSSFFIGGTPYEGGFFKMKLVLGKEFPSIPPQGFFLTKIFHPNVAKNGAICVNTLKKDWKPDHGIKHILLVRTIIKNATRVNDYVHVQYMYM